MKQYILYMSRVLFLFLLANGCNKDLGNYTYDYDKAPKLVIDTTGIDKTDIWAAWNIGDTVRITPNVTYPGKESNLVYRWFVINYPYQTVTVGNAQVWPTADTISHDRSLEYVVNLAPGRQVSLYFMAKDTVTGASAFFSMFNYKAIPDAGAVSGVYCLQEKEGRLDIDVIGSSRALIYSNIHEVDYYSSLHPDEPLTGHPLLFNYCGNYFYLFTSDVALRISPASMVIMEHWNEMFYQPPATYNPSAVTRVNNCDFLINDGKLHVHYVQSAGERKFSVPVPGDYSLAPFLSTQTIASYRPVANAINAYQVVYDEAAGAFRPFFNKGISLGRFSESAADILFDVNHMEGTLVYANTVNAGETMAILRGTDEAYNLYVSCFYNVVDNGNLARYHRPLSGCTGIENATCFASGLDGPAFFYGTGNSVYSYSYTTGQTTSHLLWEGDAGEEITALSLLGTGGFPTSGRILWIAVWNEAAKTGRLVEFEINPVSGVAEAMFAPMFSGIEDNPIFHEGMGKVVFMTQRM
ncbi:MAG: hypothetical protein LBP56_09595 [Odoribacteraceae bacterium]|nr:hypothetical protein [Odoribacteraceae bacterium]